MGTFSQILFPNFRPPISVRSPPLFMPAPRLPPELILLIIEHLMDGFDSLTCTKADRLARESVSSCVLVSRTFAAICRPLQWRTIHLQFTPAVMAGDREDDSSNLHYMSDEDIESSNEADLDEEESDEEGSDEEESDEEEEESDEDESDEEDEEEDDTDERTFAMIQDFFQQRSLSTLHIRSLALTPLTDRRPDLATFSESQLAGLLNHCPNLKDLSLENVKITRERESTTQSRLVFPRLAQLRLSGLSEWVDYRDLLDILSLFPDVEQLIITQDVWRQADEKDGVYQSTYPIPCIRELIIRGQSGRNKVLRALVKNGCCKELRSLEMGVLRLHDLTAFGDLADSIAPSLKELTLFLGPPDTWAGYTASDFGVLSTFTQLQKLLLFVTIMMDEPGWVTRILRDIFANVTLATSQLRSISVILQYSQDVRLRESFTVGPELEEMQRLLLRLPHLESVVFALHKWDGTANQDGQNHMRAVADEHMPELRKSCSLRVVDPSYVYNARGLAKLHFK